MLLTIHALVWLCDDLAVELGAALNRTGQAGLIGIRGIVQRQAVRRMSQSALVPCAEP